jgi:hypothetical protein
MKIRIPIAAWLGWGAVSLQALAATLGDSGERESLIEAHNLGWLSVGVDYAQIERSVKLQDEAGPALLKADVYSGQLGVDIVDWLTLFGTAGATQARIGKEGEFQSGRFKYSGGVRINWWHYDIKDPAFMAGRISFRSIGEYSQHESGSGSEAIQWEELYGDLILNYEFFVEKMKNWEQYPYSLALFVGPAWSQIDGQAGEGAGARSMEADQAIGVVGGLDLFFSHNLSVGAQALYYDEYTLSASIRYHF